MLKTTGLFIVTALATTDWVGATVALTGMGIMVSGWEG
jgi:drug/metabolite transporter superfamily protein YnfA|tara:strand:- start:4892 stop:5005 length:114 start_codon:yes stop_codon:yes gene_type:complete